MDEAASVYAVIVVETKPPAPIRELFYETLSRDPARGQDLSTL